LREQWYSRRMLIRCERCGATLDVDGHAPRATCKFCGATSLVPGHAPAVSHLPPPPVSHLPPEPPAVPVHAFRGTQPAPVHAPFHQPRSRSNPALVALLIVGAVAISVIGLVVRTVSSAARSSPAATTAKAAPARANTVRYPSYWKCATNEECEEGHLCVGSACKPSCKVDGDCARGGKCFPSLRNGKPQPDERVCSASCDLMDPGEICGPGVTCISDTAKKTTDCFGKSGTGSGVGGCTADNVDSCMIGFTCVRNGTSRRCARWCKMGAKDHGCPHGEHCTPLTNAPLLEGTTYGVCDVITKAPATTATAKKKAPTPKTPAPKAATQAASAK
jgi:hypothetical protein